MLPKMDTFGNFSKMLTNSSVFAPLTSLSNPKYRIEQGFQNIFSFKYWAT